MPTSGQPGEIRFEFTTDGAEQVSEAFVDLKTKQLQASQAATQLSAELTKIRQSGQVSAQGVAQLERELVLARAAAQRFEREATQVSRASRGLGQAADVASAGTRKLQGGAAEAVNMLTEMTLGLGGLSPEFREFATALASGGNNAVQLSQALGPVAGIATGLGASVIPLLVTKIYEWVTGTESATEANARLRREANLTAHAVHDLVGALRQQREVEQILSGQGTSEQIGEAVREARDVRDAIQQQLAQARAELREREALRSRGGSFAQRREAEAAVHRQRDAIDSLTGALRNAQRGYDDLLAAQTRAVSRELGSDSREDIIAAGEDEDARTARQRSRSGQSAAQRREREAREEADALVRQKADYYQELERLRQQDLRAEREAREANVRIGREIDAEIRRDEEAARRRRERERERSAREAARHLREEQRAAERATQQLQERVEGVLQPAIQGITQAVQDVASGAKSADEAFKGLLASFLEMISQQAALEAAKEFASSIASFASQDYGGGALHLAAGVAWTAVAVAAGAASVAVAPPAASAPQSPQQQAPQASAGGGTTILNVNGPILSASGRAGLGREIGQLIDESNRRFGRAA